MCVQQKSCKDKTYFKEPPLWIQIIILSIFKDFFFLYYSMLQNVFHPILFLSNVHFLLLSNRNCFHKHYYYYYQKTKCIALTIEPYLPPHLSKNQVKIKRDECMLQVPSRKQGGNLAMVVSPCCMAESKWSCQLKQEHLWQTK